MHMKNAIPFLKRVSYFLGNFLFLSSCDVPACSQYLQSVWASGGGSIKTPHFTSDVFTGTKLNDNFHEVLGNVAMLWACMCLGTWACTLSSKGLFTLVVAAIEPHS